MISGERLREQLFQVVNDFGAGGDYCEDATYWCVDRILARLPGPVMPEVPSETIRQIMLLERNIDHAWRQTRDALIAEQKECGE